MNIALSTCSCAKDQGKTNNSAEVVAEQSTNNETALEETQKESSSPAPEEEDPVKKKWLAAIETIRWSVDLNIAANSNITKEERKTMLDQLASDIEGGLTDECTIYYRLREIIAAMKHCHLRLEYSQKPSYLDDRTYPLCFMRMQEGLGLLGLEEKNKAYLGSIVTAINGHSIEEIKEKYAKIRSIETEMAKENWCDEMNVSSMKYLGFLNEGSDEIEQMPLTTVGLTLVMPTVKDELPLLSKKYGEIKESVTPDVPIILSIKDYVNGVDTIYEKIVDDINAAHKN